MASLSLTVAVLLASAASSLAGGAPSVPTGVAAVGGDGCVTISWNAVSGARSYNVYYDEEPGSPPYDPVNVANEGPSPVSTTATSLNLTGLPNGTAFYLAVTAVKGSREHDYSAQVTTTPTAPPPAPDPMPSPDPTPDPVPAPAPMPSPAPSPISPTFADIAAGLAGVRDCSLAWGDYDSDGDLDLALAGTTENHTAAATSRIYRNDAGTFTDIGAGLAGVCIGSLAWGDYDSDGDLDLALAGIGGSTLVSKVYRNDGGTFTDIAAGLTGVYHCSLAWGDYDNDGDLDLALAGATTTTSPYGPVSKVYRNDGGTFTDIGAGLTGVHSCSLAWGDYDNDGDHDLVLAGYLDGANRTSVLYRNDGGSFVDASVGLAPVGGCSVAWGDYDNDGYLDLAMAGNGAARIYRNNAGAFVEAAVGVSGVYRASLDWGDFDNDGDLDLALAGDLALGNEVARVWRNDGTTFAGIGAGLMPVGHCSLEWGDYDADGDLDLALAGSWYEGVWPNGVSHQESRIYRNDGGVLNTMPAAPGGASAAASGSDVAFAWNATADAQTPQAGLTYNLRVGTTPGGDEIMSGMAIESPNVRLVSAMGNCQHNTSWMLEGLAIGTYYWSVQAVDTGFLGGAWAPEETVTVGGTAPAPVPPPPAAAPAPRVVINEIDPGCSDWVEIHNTRNASADLTGW
ncbi:MAG: FG-GAP-like repeat-containing protein, partial [Planctomycetota bacterium]